MPVLLTFLASLMKYINLTTQFMQKRSSQVVEDKLGGDSEQKELFVHDQDPLWLKNYNTILQSISDLGVQIKHLSSKQEQKKQIQFQDALNQEILSLRGNLVTQIQKLAARVNNYKNQNSNSEDDIEYKIFASFIEKQLKSKFSTVSEQFRQLQSHFLNTIQAPQQLNLEHEDEQTKQYYAQAERTLNNHNRDVQMISKDVNELVTMIDHLSMQVFECGTILDRIDVNLADAQNFIDEGNMNLEGARKEQKKVSKWRSATYTMICLNYILSIVMISIKVGSRATKSK